MSHTYDEETPLASFAGLMAAYNGLLAGGLALLASRDRLPDRTPLGDMALLAVATHKLSRLIAKDSVTAPVRAPFAQRGESEGANEQSDEPVGEGLQKAIGELVVCPPCVGQWVAGGFVLGALAAPRLTRAVATVFAVQAGSDALHAGYAMLRDRAYGS